MEEESEKRKIEVRPPLQMETGVATGEVSNCGTLADTDSEQGEKSEAPKSEITAEKMPKTTAGGSAINITISNGEIRSVIAPVVCTQPSTSSCAPMGRAIAPKPVAVSSKAQPILEALGTALTKTLEQNPELRSAPPTLLITSNPNNQSQMIATTSTNTANTMKLTNKTIPMALVPTSDGSQMIAVPLSGLNAARGKAQLITIPVQLSGSGATQIVNKGKSTITNAAMKAKMVINPSKIAATVTTTVSSNVVATVLPTPSASHISLSKMQPQGSSAFLPDSSDDNKIQKANNDSSTSKNGTIVTVCNEYSQQSNVTSTTDGTTEILPPNCTLSSNSPAFTPVAVSEMKNSPAMPPKVTVTISSGATQANDHDCFDNAATQSSSSATSVTVMMGSPPVSSSASTVTLTSQSANDSTSSDAQKTDLVTNSDFDPVNIMEWKDGIGTLPGSHLKFKINEFGTLEMVDDDEAEEVMKKHSLKNNEEKMRRSVTITASPTGPGSGTSNPVIQVYDPDEIRTCVNCGVKDVRSKFIRQGKFCSQQCATIQSTRLRNFSKNITLKDANPTEKKPSKTKAETTVTVGRPPKTRKLSSEKEAVDCSPNNSRPSTPCSLNNSSAVNQSQITIKEEPVAWENRLRNFKNSSTSVKDSTISKKKAAKSKCDTFAVQNSAQRQIKVQKLSTDKPEKVGNENSPENSRPSSPAGNHLAALHQSIFALRVNQQQQEAPVAWGKHSKTLLPLCDKIKPCEVFTWNPEKVANFVSSIPGCVEFGQAFLDELVDGEAFLLLNQPDLVKILGIKLGPAVKIYNSILVIRDNMNLEEA